MGRMFAAYRVEASLVAAAASPRMGSRFGFPRTWPRSLAALRATLVHCEMRRPLFERGVQLQPRTSRRGLRRRFRSLPMRLDFVHFGAPGDSIRNNATTPA